MSNKITKYLPGEKYGKLTILKESAPHINPSGRKSRKVLCRCECGNKTIANTDHLGDGTPSSCGEGMCDPNRQYHPPIASAQSIFRHHYHDGDLTFEQFLELSQQNCYYCNAIPFIIYNKDKSDTKFRAVSQFSIDNGDFKYNGLDRVDNDLPHNKDNVVPCCKICNSAKSDISVNDFSQLIIRIIQYWKIPFIQDIKSFPTTNQLLQSAIQQNIFIPQKPILVQDNNPNRYGSLVIVDRFFKKDKHQNRTYVRCICDCGNNWSGYLQSLIQEDTKSCGSKCPYYRRNKYHPQLTSAGDRFRSDYSDGDLTLEQFYLISQLDCWYCGKKAINSNQFNKFTYKKLGGYAEQEGLFCYNGLDRVNNDLPHNIDNIVPCCIDCNMAKNDLTITEFATWLERVYPWAIDIKINNKGFNNAI